MKSTQREGKTLQLKLLDAETEVWRGAVNKTRFKRPLFVPFAKGFTNWPPTRVRT